MMSNRTDEHFLDTNVLIECHRVGCWKALAANYRLATVDKVLEECGTGGGRRQGYVNIDTNHVKAHVTCHPVSRKALADLRLRIAGQVSLDPGEEQLLAKAMTQPGLWRICSPDKALLRACWTLNYLDRVVSLGELLQAIGHQSKILLQYQYTRKWLEEKRTDFLLGS